MNCLHFKNLQFLLQLRIVKIILFIFLLFLFLIFFVSQVQAASINYIYNQSPPPGLSLCSDSCPAPSICWNSESPGVTDCGAPCPAAGGNAWTKYENKGCFEDPIIEGRCNVYYTALEAVCSTADKCTTTSNNPYLNAGSCSCTTGARYKVCCNGTQVSGASCVQFAVDTINPPWEGTCPSGTTTKFCGFGGYPSCDSPAVCGAVPVTCTPQPSQAYTQCGGTGGCTNSYPADHTVQITPSTCSDGSTTLACSDLGKIAGQCGNPLPPTLNSFNISASCPNNSATLSWSGTALSPTDSCPNGYWVDIANNPNFVNYSNKCVTSTSLTTTGSDFGGPGGAFSFISGTTYYARVFNNSPDNNGHSNTRSIIAPSPNCASSCSLTRQSCSPVSNGTECIFTSTYSVNNTSQSSYQRNLTPDNSNPSIQTGWRSNSQTLSWIYQTGNYTAKLDARGNDASFPASCTTSVNIAPQCPINNSACCSSPLTTCSANSQCPTGYQWCYQGICINEYYDSAKNTCNPPTSSCSINVGTVTRNSNNQYNSTTINWNYNLTGSTVHFYNPGTCSLSSCPSSGWTLVTSSGFTGSHSYNWNPNGVAPSGGGTRTMGVTDSNNVLKCVTNVSFPAPSQGCSLSASPPSGNVPLNTTLSVTNLDTSTMPPSKRSQWDCQGDSTFESEDTAVSHNCSYNSSGTYAPAFRVVNNPGGNTVLAQCSTSVNATVPGGGGGPVQQNYCPQPFNDSPTVTLNPDGVSVTVRYSFQRDSNNTPSVTFYRNSQPGFLPAGTLLGNQVGNFAKSYDTNPPEQEYVSYQIEGSNGTSFIKSNALAVRTLDEGEGGSCSPTLFYSLPNITGATFRSSTESTLTFDLTYTVDSTGFNPGCQMPCNNQPTYTPPYLKLSRTSGGNAFISWNNNPSRSECISQTYQWGRRWCRTTQHTTSYTIALPPNTADTFSVSGYHDAQCSYRTAQGSASFTGQTQAGNASNLVPTPTLTRGELENPDNQILVELNWDQTSNGHQFRVYRNTGNFQRWPQNNSFSGSRSFNADTNTWTFTGTQDLTSLPAGTYYFGAYVSQAGWCSSLQTDQRAFIWVPPIGAWVQTSGGDVHSNTNITTPGGP